MWKFPFLLMLSTMPFAGAGANGVDAAIVFAIDASASIDPNTAKLQREGHVAALSEPSVISAISAGFYGCIAITYIEWASPGQTRSVLPWSRICDREDALVAALAIHRKGTAGGGCNGYCATSISHAIDTGRAILDSYRGNALSKIIDISASGMNNDGPPVEQSRRQEPSTHGYTINAIVIPQVQGSATYHLLGYFTDHVIGGPGLFAVEPLIERDYMLALQRKLVREISMSLGQLGGRQGAFLIVNDETVRSDS